MTTWTPTTDDRWPGAEGVAFRGPTGHTATLSDLLALDAYPIEVNADGTLTERPDLYVPDVVADLDAHGAYVTGADDAAAADLAAQGWEPMRGYTGQHGQGPASWFMHAAEFIGGALARDILAVPGTYAAVAIIPVTPDDETVDSTEWTVIRRTT